MTNLVAWLLRIGIAIVLFIVAIWLIPFLFGLVGIGLPDNVAKALAALIALLWIYGHYAYPSWRARRTS